jgi:hypothetical protein
MSAIPHQDSVEAYLIGLDAEYHYVKSNEEHNETIVAHPGGIFLLDFDDSPTILQVSESGTISLK